MTEDKARLGAAESGVSSSDHASIDRAVADLSPVQLYRSNSAGIAGAPVDGGVAVVTPELAIIDEHPHPAPPLISTARTLAIAAVTTATMAFSGAGSMSLSIALPLIQEDLDMPEAQLQWISSAFALTNGCFLLLAGRVSDVYGRKMCFVAGGAFYSIFTLIGAFMNTASGLIVTRALSGVGSAFAIPSAIGIIATSFTGRTRTSAFACFSAGGPIGGGIGLIVGGLLVSYTDQTWRAALWTFAGGSALVAIAGWLVVLPDRDLDPDRRIDWVGAAIITVGLVLLQFAVSDAQTATHGWKSGYIIALIVISVLLIAFFFCWEYYVEHYTSRPPLMSLQLWTRAKGRLASTYLVGGISWMGFSTMFYSATLWYQQVQDTGTIGAMLRFLPTTVSGLLCNILVAKMVHIIPGQALICIGILATGLANLLFAISPADVNYWRMPFNAMWLAVLGADFLMAVGSIFVSTLALPNEQSVAGALFQTLVQLGGALGLAFVSVVQTSLTNKSKAAGDDELTQRVKGLHGGFWFAAGSSFAALLLALVMLRGMGRYKPKKTARSTKTNATAETAATAVDDEADELPVKKEKHVEDGEGEGSASAVAAAHKEKQQQQV